jgi:hypothetical protein
MSSPSSIDVAPRREQFAGVHTFDGWTIKLFLIAAAAANFVDEQEARRSLTSCLRDIGARVSSEFDYGRFGFAIAHAGRRGTCLTVTHFGLWGTTFEVFSSGWYRYGQAAGDFALLDDIEPAFCWFEFPRTFYEVRLACELARDRNLDAIRSAYLAVQA